MYSKNIYAKSKAGETTFAFTFPYLKESDVHVKRVRSDAVTEEQFILLTGNQIKLKVPTALNDIIIVYRATSLDKRAVDFQNGAVLTEKDLDDSNIQLFYAMQEAEDGASSGLVELADGVIDARMATIINVADPKAPTDTTNKRYVDDNITALSESVDTRLATNKAAIDKDLADNANHIYSDNNETEANIKSDNVATAAKIKADNVATAAKIKADNTATRTHTSADVVTVTSAKEVVLTSEAHVVSLDKETATNTATVLQAAKEAKASADRAASNATLAGLPIGSYVWYPADDPKNAKDKNGLFIPDGRLLKREQCKDLWNAVQSGELPSVSEAEWQAGQQGVYSTGDGVSTFRLPSIGGYFVRIAGSADPDYSTRKVGAVQEDQNKAHTHKLTVVADAVKTVMSSDFDYGTKTSNWTGDHTHSGTTNSTGNHNHSTRIYRSGDGGSAWTGFAGSPSNSYAGWIDATQNTTGNHQHSFNTNSAGNHRHVTAIGSHNHTTEIPAHTHSASAASEGGNETRPTNTWMQPYIVWYQANNAKIGGFQLHGSWDVERNIVIGDPMNNKLSFGVAPRLPAGMDADGIGYLCVTEGKSNLIGADTTMLRGDRVVWYGSTWVHIQHSQVTSVNGKTGDVELTAEMLDTYTKEQADAAFLNEKQTDARYIQVSDTTKGATDPRNKVVAVDQEGKAEIGSCIEMHVNGSAKDYDARITVGSDGALATSGDLTVANTLNAEIVQQKGKQVFSPSNYPNILDMGKEPIGVQGHAWTPALAPTGKSSVLFANSVLSNGGYGLGMYSYGSLANWGDTSVNSVVFQGVTAHQGVNEALASVVASGMYEGTSFINQATGVYVQTMRGGNTGMCIVDFNTLLTTGIYLQDSDNNMSKCSNTPTTRSGCLEVFTFSTSWLFQRYTRYDTGEMYTRTRYGGNWNAWHHVG